MFKFAPTEIKKSLAQVADSKNRPMSDKETYRFWILMTFSLYLAGWISSLMNLYYY